MKYRPLGKTNFVVSEVGYGAWGISGKQWIGASDDNSIHTLTTAMRAGINFIDTALAYGDGHSEKLVGRAISEIGHQIYVATKVPPKNRIWPAKPGVGIEDVFPYDYIIKSTEESIKNLGLDSVDLQQLHVWNPDWIASEEWRRAAEDLKKSGKIRAFGISINDHQPDTALAVIQTGLVDTVQVIYNIFDQTADRHLFESCVDHKVGVIVRVPFDEGSLTGRITEKTEFPEGDWRNSYFGGDRKRQVVERVNALANEIGLSDVHHLAEIAMRFCLSNPAVSTVIPGMRSLSSVQGNVAASGMGPLPPNVLEVLRQHAWDRNFYSPPA